MKNNSYEEQFKNALKELAEDSPELIGFYSNFDAGGHTSIPPFVPSVTPKKRLYKFAMAASAACFVLLLSIAVLIFESGVFQRHDSDTVSPPEAGQTEVDNPAETDTLKDDENEPVSEELIEEGPDSEITESGIEMPPRGFAPPTMVPDAEPIDTPILAAETPGNTIAEFIIATICTAACAALFFLFFRKYKSK
jgi:hypothetical protein